MNFACYAKQYNISQQELVSLCPSITSQWITRLDGQAENSSDQSRNVFEVAKPSNTIKIINFQAYPILEDI